MREKEIAAKRHKIYKRLAKKLLAIRLNLYSEIRYAGWSLRRN